VAALTQAGDRSSSLAASAEALRYFEQALELIDDPLEAAELHHRAGDMAWRIADFKGAREHDEAAAQGFEQAGQGRSAAKALASLGGLDYQEGELERGAERLRGAYEAMRDLHDADFAEVAAEFARLLLFTGHNEECLPIIDEALAAAERERTLMVLGHALNTKGIMLVDRGRTEEATALLEHALAMSEREGLSDVVLRSTNNLSAFMERWDRYAEALRLAASGLDVATRLGHASWRWKFVAGHVGPLVWMGRWDEADRFGRELIDSDVVVGAVRCRTAPARVGGHRPGRRGARRGDPSEIGRQQAGGDPGTGGSVGGDGGVPAGPGEAAGGAGGRPGRDRDPPVPRNARTCRRVWP